MQFSENHGELTFFFPPEVFFTFGLPNKLPVDSDSIPEFGITISDFANVLFFACWTNDYINEVSSVKCHFSDFKKIC